MPSKSKFTKCQLLARLIAFFLRPLVVKQWEILQKRIDSEQIHLAHDPELMPPLIMQQLLVSGEDHRHSWHPGFDIIGICRAIWRRLSKGKREGASTIEQQIVRSILGNYECTVRRKMVEIILSTAILSAYPKKILPAIYLSIGYYGWGMNGYREACWRLNICPKFLTLAEAAALVARLKYPEPRIASISRIWQIRFRAQHLILLYRHHVTNGTYKHLSAPQVKLPIRVLYKEHSGLHSTGRKTAN